ncbi:WSC domain-containing protein [Chaetomidium leptoderma]|uniref:WSC domain-containing protein n=1 Tax=Chaetomidium leptoderma TaxID=669021 RepID=A0AAN6VFR0_9PEZI|nr:WSC domain-containing protein [Chaetomidium leptoderma]
MKTSAATILSLVALARRVSCSNNPELQWDPETAPDCSCEYVRSYFTITPEEFHKWNPSVSLDCEPWRWQSYCIVTLERLENTNKTKTTFTTTASSTTTSSAPTLGPSPTGWLDLGCYEEDPELPILEKNTSPAGGDGSLTIAKCQDACYRARYKFAGMQEGNQCWCSSYVGGGSVRDQADCNTPCPGNATTFCGGKGVLQVYEAVSDLELLPITDTAISTSTSTSTGSSGSGSGSSRSTAVETRASSGAERNAVLFGRMG